MTGQDQEEVQKECLKCGEIHPVSELGVENNIVGTCPNCGGHRFRTPQC